MRQFFFLLALPMYAFAGVECPRVPSADMSKEQASFVEQVDYQLLGTAAGSVGIFGTSFLRMSTAIRKSSLLHLMVRAKGYIASRLLHRDIL
ncbi:MAG: hypothetical protein ACJ8LG_23035 [Massilia sp.]